MGKILYIAEDLKGSSGGQSCMSRNLNHIVQIFGEAKTFVYKISTDTSESSFQKVYKELRFESVLRVDKTHLKSIANIVSKEDIRYVFLDSSLLGSVAKYLKQKFTDIRIVVFFHNIEYLQMKEQWKLTKNQKFIWRIWIAKRNEKYCCRYANVVICLNKRDSDVLNLIYNRNADILIPISLKDDYIPPMRGQVKQNIPLGLFLGSFFPPNIEAVDWFITKILPKVNMKFIVCGSGMDILRNKYIDNQKVEIYGFVDKLSEVYEKADFVVLPILSGSGMKVKTAEALKYGKKILAMPEALVGYSTTTNEAILCNNEDDFVQAIQDKYNWGQYYNPSSRELYLQKYSYSATLSCFQKIFSGL